MRLMRRLSTAASALMTSPRIGRCELCDQSTLFVQLAANIRESFLCVRCRSKPRERALYRTLERLAPNWRELAVYEPGLAGALSKKLAESCKNLTQSLYLPAIPRGEERNGVRSEDLQALTFASETFDVVLTQDVLEHVLQPELAFREIARVLRPNGLHLFTVPYNSGQETQKRAELRPDGGVRLIQPAEYHGDPLDPGGALVVTDWGTDLPKFVDEASGVTTELVLISDPEANVRVPITLFASRRLG